MSIVCPTVLAHTVEEYNSQIKKITPFATRIQVDLTDGIFTTPKTIAPKDVWWPPSLVVDLHLMYQNPFEVIEQVILIKPQMAIIHVEAMVHHMHFAAELHKEGIKAGLAVLPETPIKNIEQILHSFDHLLIFGGHLGHFGGEADMQQLPKAAEAKAHHKDLEIGWDGGINDQNAKPLIDGGIDVLNVGGYIQKAEKPEFAFERIRQQIR